MSEEWRVIPRYDSLYEVSSLGRVQSLDRTIPYKWRGIDKTIFKAGRILQPERDRDGYLRFRLSDKNGKQRKWGCHQLVALAFHPNPNELPEVAHIDHNRQNNRPENLKWTSRSGNHTDSVIENRFAQAGPNIGSKRTFTADEVREIRAKYALGIRQSEIAKLFGVRQEQIRKIVSRERWRHVD